jgi:hypothetical protein
MRKATKKPADSQRKTSGAAASILAQMGGAEAVTVHVFRRIEGGKHAFLRAYSADEAEHIQDRVLTDHGPGFYLVQVKEGTQSRVGQADRHRGQGRSPQGTCIPITSTGIAVDGNLTTVHLSGGSLVQTSRPVAEVREALGY